jgi:superfamily II DNA/RNA helicase
MSTQASFESFSLPPKILEALKISHINIPSPLQGLSIPTLMAGNDFIAMAKSGTGRTLAFCLPLMGLIDKVREEDFCALVLTPHRDSAIQINDVLNFLCVELDLPRPVLVMGGSASHYQIEGLKSSPKFIVATPGRLVDLMLDGHTQLDRVKFVVVDEADKMIDMGFAPQLNEILKGLPVERQSVLFTTDFTEEVSTLCEKYLKNPTRVEIKSDELIPASSVEKITLELEEPQKFEKLLEILAENEGPAIVFTRTKYRAERLARQLEKKDMAVGRIHPDRSLTQRQATLKAFRENEFRILVATDIAARGIDVAHVALVVNFDIPNVPEDFLLRLGRTGRDGVSGKAFSFVSPEVREEWRAILRLIDPELYEKTPHVPNAPRPEKPQAAERSEKPEKTERTERSSRHEKPKRAPQQQPREAQPETGNPRTAKNWDDEDDDYYPQPSLEEQMNRIDSAAGVRRHARPQNQNNGNGRSHNNRNNNSGRNPKRPYEKDNRAARPVRRNFDDEGSGNR